MKITVGVPCYKAEKTICDLLASIQMQSVSKEDVEIILAKDRPEDNYEFVKPRYPELNITILDCTENTGPGLARQRALDAATTDWITFIDADDVLMTPFALEDLIKGVSTDVIEVQGTFFQEISSTGTRDYVAPTTINAQVISNNEASTNDGPALGTPENPIELKLPASLKPQAAGLQATFSDGTEPRANPMLGVNHPWVFARLYNIPFLRENDIRFTSLRAMEDGEFNWKIRMLIEGTNHKINIIPDSIYLWRTGSEHSITRIGMENGIPQYNYDLCIWGATTAAIGAANFCKDHGANIANIRQFVLEQMVGQYFSYYECLNRKPVFAEQTLFNGKKLYHEAYKQFEEFYTEDMIRQAYSTQLIGKAQDMLGIIPDVTFWQYFQMIHELPYGGDKEFQEIRSRLPQSIIDNDLKTGVLGARVDD